MSMTRDAKAGIPLPTCSADPLPRAHVSALRRAGGALRQCAAIALFFGVGLGVTLITPLLLAIPGRSRRERLGQSLIRILFRFYVRSIQQLGLFSIEFEGFERLQDLRGVIITANHPGILDAVFLLSRLPNAVCVMRAGLMRHPSMCGAASLAGYVPNDRGVTLVRHAAERLRQGTTIVIFPEGTRTRSQPVNRFKKGFALAATLTGSPVQTVWIERSAPYFARGVGFVQPSMLPIRVRLSVGERIAPLPGEEPRAFAQRLEVYFRSNLENTGDAIRLRPDHRHRTPGGSA